MPVSDYPKGSKRKARRNVRQPCVAHTLAGECIYFPLTYPKQGGSRERPCAHWHSRSLTVADSDDPYQPSADAHQRNHGEPWGATGIPVRASVRPKRATPGSAVSAGDSQAQTWFPIRLPIPTRERWPATPDTKCRLAWRSAAGG